MATVSEFNPPSDHPAACLFEAMADSEYSEILKLYASNARSSVVSYLSMKSRWSRQQESCAKSEEKLDEILQQLSYEGRTRFSPTSAMSDEDDSSFSFLLKELAVLASGEVGGFAGEIEISREADRMVWESANVLSDTRPPSNFCVYNRDGCRTPPTDSNMPPIFDGSVANATPPPLGGAGVGGASGGSGTILHLACAMDQPLPLAFLLCMGADGRASHTAFRRLMIHEAACNGSIQCLTLLLEMGQRYAKDINARAKENSIFLPDAFELNQSSSTNTRSLPSLASRLSRAPPPLSMAMRHFRREATTPSTPQKQSGNFLGLLKKFQRMIVDVEKGEMNELEAARSLLADVHILDTTKASLVRSCSFKPSTDTNSFTSRAFLRPPGCSDGHGNSPLHWAAFKNETECVSLLLQYNADPNARAHPSGWTPLHDAAYSNSAESIGLLVSSGAQVDARANSGATPLCFAAQEDAAEAARLLLERGAMLTARCAGGTNSDIAASHPQSRFSGYTPLHYCAHYNAHKASAVLLKHDAAKLAMETPDLSGRLPIHVAVSRGSSDVLKELLHAGARIDLRPGSDLDGANSQSSFRSSTATQMGSASIFALPVAEPLRQPPSPETTPRTPNRNLLRMRTVSPAVGATSPVTSPVLRSMIPSQPISSSKPWNCLTQQAIDECKDLISKAERSWAPERHSLFTPQDRKAVLELLKVGKRLEQDGSGIFVDLWPQVLSFCGRGWFEKEDMYNKPRMLTYQSNLYRSDDMENDSESDDSSQSESENADSDFSDFLSLPSLGAR